jgi:imidazolonepropionase-like amidohydrolase
MAVCSNARRHHRLPPFGRVRLFDSRTGQMLTRQVVIIQGEKIAEVGAEGQVRIPAGMAVLDLSQATVLPGLIDAHTHMFNTPTPKMSRETSTLIAIQNLQADLYAGFTSARDMSSHANGYADVDVRNAINEGRIDGPRFQVSGRGIVWSGSPTAAPDNPLASTVVNSVEQARAAVRDHDRSRSGLDQAVSGRCVFVFADRGTAVHRHLSDAGPAGSDR